METIFKEKYGYMADINDKELFCSCNIYTIKANAIHFFGIEDVGGGIDMEEDIPRIANHCIQKYKPAIENAFFLRWYTRYTNRGVEWLEVYWDQGIPIDYDFTQYCKYTENPFINFYTF